MDKVILDVNTRDAKVKIKDLLKKNLIPAVYYGRGVENLNLQIDYQSFRKTFKVAGASTILELHIDGKKKVNVLVHDVSYDPISDKVTHVDFMNVRMDEEVTTSVPLTFVGTSIAVKDFGGTFVTQLHEVEVRCLPKDLPHDILISIDSLTELHSSLHVSDIVVPKGVQILEDLNAMVATVVPPREEKEENVSSVASVEVQSGAEGQKSA